MFQVTVVFGTPQTAWPLMFHKEEDAAEAHNKLIFALGREEDINVSDDFGQIATFARGTIAGIMREDTSKTQLAHIEQALHRARMQAKVQQAAASDATLRAAARLNTPPVFTPQMGGFPNGGGFQ